jgi:hypothetical protein
MVDAKYKQNFYFLSSYSIVVVYITYCPQKQKTTLVAADRHASQSMNPLTPCSVTYNLF